jgi:hypothetical protein
MEGVVFSALGTGGPRGRDIYGLTGKAAGQRDIFRH